MDARAGSAVATGVAVAVGLAVMAERTPVARGDGVATTVEEDAAVATGDELAVGLAGAVATTPGVCVGIFTVEPGLAVPHATAEKISKLKTANPRAMSIGRRIVLLPRD